MLNNLTLNNARYAKNDEFYTKYSDIERELKHYSEEFIGKTVYCNCDDPYKSKFFQYFKDNFDSLGIKRLICTNYCGVPMTNSLFCSMSKVNEDSNAYVVDITTGSDDSVHILDGSGDFRSKECIEYLDQCDIVVTNPPFSLFRNFIDLMFDHDKQFIIVGNQNAVTYKNVFSLMNGGVLG